LPKHWQRKKRSNYRECGNDAQGFLRTTGKSAHMASDFLDIRCLVNVEPLMQHALAAHLFAREHGSAEEGHVHHPSHFDLAIDLQLGLDR